MALVRPTAVAGVSPVGLKSDPRRVEKLRRDGLIAFPENLQVSRNEIMDSIAISDTFVSHWLLDTSKFGLFRRLPSSFSRYLT